MGWLQPLELAAFDQMVRLDPEEEPDPRLPIVEITEGGGLWISSGQGPGTA